VDSALCAESAFYFSNIQLKQIGRNSEKLTQENFSQRLTALSQLKNQTQLFYRPLLIIFE
jgi:DNA-binding transcriptional regulator YiaG